MRILLISPEFPPHTPGGGIGTYVAQTAPAMAALGHEVHVLALGWRFPDRTFTADDGVKVFLRPLRPRTGALVPLAPAAPRAALRSALAGSARHWAKDLDGPYDVVEAPDWAGHGLDIPRHIALRRFVHLHTGIAVASRWERAANPIDLRLSVRLEQDSMLFADHAVAPSDLIVRATSDACSRLPEATVIPIGIDAASLVAEPLAGGVPDILVVGRLQARKRPDLVLDAVRALATDVSCTVTFAGKTTDDRRGRDYEAALRQQASTIGAEVRFAGQLDQAALDEAYRRARVVVVPSDFESYSMVAVEAVARARPVIVTDGVGAAEVLAPVADIVPAGSASALAAALRPLLTDPDLATARGLAGRELALAELDLGGIAARRIELYASL